MAPIASAETFRPVRLSAAGVNFRFDQSGTNRIDANSLLRQFLGQANRQCVQSCLRPGIVDVFEGRTQPAGR